MEEETFKVNEPNPEWPECYIFSVAATSEDDSAMEAYGPTYEDAAQWALAGLTLRAKRILEEHEMLMIESDELRKRGVAIVRRAKEIKKWLGIK